MGYKLAVACGLMLLMVCGVSYWYYTDTQKRMAILQENNAKLEVAVQTSEATIDALQQDYARLAEVNQELNQEFAEIRRQNQVLSDKLEKHDLGVLAQNKPGLVERVIDKASDKAGRCFELLSGAELTEEEKNAKTENEFNSECPWLYDTYRDANRLQPIQPATSGD